MKNLPAFKKLINRYETVTLEEIKEVYNLYDDIYFAKQALTGIGNMRTCKLCKGLSSLDNCYGCIYSEVGGYDAYSCTDGKNAKTYHAIKRAKTPKQLLKAYRNRAKHMRGILKTLNIEL